MTAHLTQALSVPLWPWQARAGSVHLLTMGLRLRELRKERRLTQVELADKLGVSHAAVSRWERGKRNPTVADIYQIAAILQCHPGEILAPLPSSPDPQSDEARALGYLHKLDDPSRRALWFQAGDALAEWPTATHPATPRRKRAPR